MGKNNRSKNKKDQYVHEDLNSKFLKPKSNNSNNNRGGYNGGYNKPKKHVDEPIPELSGSVMYVLGQISDQLNEYMSVKDKMSDMTVTERRDIENRLFSLDTWPVIFSEDDSHIYMLNRMAKLDRDTHEPIRVTMLVMIQVDGVPKYVIDVYLTKNYTGNAVVHQMDKNGPNRKWSKIFNIVDGELKL